MEESPEAHMDTDVTSTTQDVPDTQEVTGSNGHVEMVIVVEKLEEEDENISSSIQRQPSSLSNDNAAALCKPSEETQQVVAEPEAIVKESSNTELKEISQEIIQNNIKPEILPKTIINELGVKSPQKITQAEVMLKSSPFKVIAEKSPQKCSQQESVSKLSPVKDISEKSPIKVIRVQTLLQKSPVKDFTDKSPQKDTEPEKIKIMSPFQDVQEQSPQKITQTEIMPKIAPCKDVEVLSQQKTIQPEITNTSFKDVELVPLSNNQELAQKLDSKDIQKNNEIELAQIQEDDTEASLPEQSNEESVIIHKAIENSPKKIQQDTIENSPKKDAPIPVQILPTEELILSDFTESTLSKENSQVAKCVFNGKEQSFDNSNNSRKSSPMPIDITIERDSSMDSQVELMSVDTNSTDTSDREHNKSTSRELKSLIKSAKESKIISACTQLTSKRRKSISSRKSALETSSNLNSSAEADKIQGVRRTSINSQKSNSSEKSEKIPVKRSMRSQNPEFVNKVKQFLSSVTGKYHKDSGDDDDDEVEIKVKDKRVAKDKSDPNDSVSSPTPPKIKKADTSNSEKSGNLRNDLYCWRCHWTVEQANNEKGHSPIYCTVCPRSYHYKCLTSTEKNKIIAEKCWVCSECILVLQAESSETRSPSMKKISLSMLCDLLKYAIERMMDLNGVEPFMQPVDRAAFPDYDKYVVHPMDLSQMQKNITDGLYGSPEAFLADANWILHNSIIFNTMQSKLTAGARALVRSCRTEMGEIEACPECYAAAHARKPTWFTDVCTTPHILLWAKLKGFPYWPAKGMSVSAAGHVDVRFFGAHDRAWVPAKDCFLYSEKDPNNFRTKRQDIIDSMKEAEEHIRNISRKYGKFVYPPFKTQLEPSNLTQQLKVMIPSFKGELRMSVKEKPGSSLTPATKKRRSYSTKSYTDMSETETHDSEQSTPVHARKMADGAEIAREDEEVNEKSDINMEIIVTTKDKETLPDVKDTEQSQQENNDNSRKRRHSELEEAVITIMEKSNQPPDIKKRKKSVSKQEKEKKKLHEQGTTNNKESEKKQESVAKAQNKSVEETKTEETTTGVNKPSGSLKTEPEKEKNLRVTPIRIAFIQKDKQHNLRTSTPKESVAKIITPIKDKVNETTPTRQKSARTEKADKEKTSEKTTKEDKLTRSEKRRNSRNNRSLSGTPTRIDKLKNTSNEKKSEKSSERRSSKEDTQDSNDKAKDSKVVIKEKESEKSIKEKTASPKPIAESSDGTAAVKNRLHVDDDKTLAVIARENKTVIISNNTRLPTITSIRSLSTLSQNSCTTSTKTTTNTKPIEITVDANSVSCTMTHTSVDSGNSDTDNAPKLQKLRSETESMIGRVGVRAFARMTSPEKSPPKNDVQVEIKTEPMDVDDADRQIEKLNLMNAFRLRPVNPQTTGANKFTELRVNKVVVTPVNTKKTVTKTVEVKPRAKKSFPQSKKPEDGQLNSKNSMVYIPIQPPMTQAPVRPARVIAGPTGSTIPPKPIIPTSTVGNNLVNTVTTPIMPVSSVPSSPSCTIVSAGTTAGIPSLGPVPAAVHTLPLMTSVNGQWMFSLQPVMSVGAIENTQSAPILNGVAERGCNTPMAHNTMPLSNTQNTPTIQNISSVSGVPPLVTSVLPASRTTVDNNSPGDLPRLQQRPTNMLLNPLDSNTPIGNVPTPSTAGPLTAKLNQSAVKLADFFRTLLEDSLEKLDVPATHVTAAKLQLEQMKWSHQTEIHEMRHNHELTISEMRALFEKEKLRAVAEVRRAAQVELESAIKATKAKQWCANCNQEAQFYCCWNTSYCDYPCQRAHWSQHFNVCTQQRQDGSTNGEPPILPESRLQPQPDNMPKNMSAPTLTVGGKVAPSRIYTPEQNNTTTNPQKSAIIVSMVEDKSGNQTMKCVGTYKSNTPAQNVSPVVLNKQIMNNEETSNKKVVSSGGYLIVGGGSSSSVVTPARRGHAIHYYT